MKNILLVLIIILPSMLMYTIEESQPANIVTDTNPAMNHPSEFAWKLFAEINKPLDSKNPNGPVVWEGWALAQNVFEFPAREPKWQEVSKSAKDFLKIATPPIQQLIVSKSVMQREKAFDPSEPSRRMGGLSETRFNKSVFDFVVLNQLYYQEGIEAYLKLNSKLDLPTDAKEVKAVWDTIRQDQLNEYHYTIETKPNGKKLYWGLVSLHIISKDIPQWTWATFEHINNPGLKKIEKTPLKSVDDFGRQDGKISQALIKLFNEKGMPAKWKNYILRGTQTNFVTLTGETTYLANTYTENGFLYTSSCITCHSKASMGGTLAFSELPEEIQDSISEGVLPENRESASHYFNSLDFVDSILTRPDPISKERIKMVTGVPHREWYTVKYNSGRTDEFKQLDFMWSFIRAKRRNPYVAP